MLVPGKDSEGVFGEYSLEEKMMDIWGGFPHRYKVEILIYIGLILPSRELAWEN